MCRPRVCCDWVLIGAKQIEGGGPLWVWLSSIKVSPALVRCHLLLIISHHLHSLSTGWTTSLKPREREGGGGRRPERNASFTSTSSFQHFLFLSTALCSLLCDENNTPFLLSMGLFSITKIGWPSSCRCLFIKLYNEHGDLGLSVVIRPTCVSERFTRQR